MWYIIGYLLFAVIVDALLGPPKPVREAKDGKGAAGPGCIIRPELLDNLYNCSRDARGGVYARGREQQLYR